ncbi:MAG: serine/threonine protein kinase [Chitinophagaceae bacterium]|nr:serine/threonine protein kinase [Chitinophagaceae bacterium]
MSHLQNMDYANKYQEIGGYRLIEKIGSGGMGDVYKAFNAALNRTAAIKILHQKNMGERFKNEAYIQSSVSHPNIACLYEYLVTGDTACIIMEYVEGDSLDVYLHRRGKLSNEETENIIKQIAAALVYLHNKDILHRDIKPQNFKVQPNGTVTMLDFGIAKNKYTPKLTQQGYLVGTTEYMAPEQFQQQVQKKSDVWSLGVLTYELLTGYMPFDANNAVTMRVKIEKGEFTRPRILLPHLSDKLNTFIEKSLQVNPANRFSAAAAEALFKEEKPVLKPAGSMHNPKPLWANKKILMIAAGLLLLVIIAVTIPKNTNIALPEQPEPDVSDVHVEPGNELTRTLSIDVSNVSNAYIILQNGDRKKLPYEITGKEGESFKFRLEADGYESKDVDVSITVGRKSYEYNLDKIK